MSPLRLVPVLIVSVLSACATGPSLILLTSEEGKQGSVAVLEHDGIRSDDVIDELNSWTNLSGRPHSSSIDPAKLDTRLRRLLEDLPPAPVYRTLYFLEGTTRITPDSVPNLEFLKSEIARRPGAEVLVTGYTDTVGSSDDNDELSQRRAEEILKGLVEQGIAISMMSAVGRGERELLDKTRDNVSSALNRRVVVTVR